MKIRQDNDMTDCIGVVYVENEMELSCSIRQGAICEKNEIGQ